MAIDTVSAKWKNKQTIVQQIRPAGLQTVNAETTQDDINIGMEGIMKCNVRQIGNINVSNMFRIRNRLKSNNMLKQEIRIPLYTCNSRECCSSQKAALQYWTR